MVCMIPFDMSRLDGNVKNEEQLIVYRIINQAKVSCFKLVKVLIMKVNKEIFKTIIIPYLKFLCIVLKVQMVEK